MSIALCATNLSKRFRNVKVLDGLNLEVHEGSIFGLIGANGAGKTTTIKILTNMMKPTAGRAELLGIDTNKLSPSDFTQVGYVSENQEMPDWMTVEYLLAYLKPFYPSWDDGRAAELVRHFELPTGRILRHLSRGMRMKAALASCLAYHPRLLILDEPFSGLDPVMREDLIEGILESASETTVFLSSHDLSDIESFASHIGYLHEGRLQFSEEMATLSARFREIEVTLSTQANPGADRAWPASWLRPQSSPVVVRFVESNFDSERTKNDISRIFGGVQQTSVNPMPLRAIFVALARGRSKAA